MSREEKNNIISLVTTLVVTIPYLVYIFNKSQNLEANASAEISFWAGAILILIPIRIVTEIIMHIIAAIITAAVTQKEPVEITDERDNLINLKATRNGYYAFALGFVISLLTIVAFESIALLFATMLITGFLAEIVEIVSKIYYYRRGV